MLKIVSREMKKTLVEASAKESKLTVSLDQRQAEIAELKKELASLKQALEDEASSKTALQQSKVDLENAQKMLQLEIEQLKERVVREEKKSASLAEQVKASEEGFVFLFPFSKSNQYHPSVCSDDCNAKWRCEPAGGGVIEVQARRGEPVQGGHPTKAGRG